MRFERELTNNSKRYATTLLSMSTICPSYSRMNMDFNCEFFIIRKPNFLKLGHWFATTFSRACHSTILPEEKLLRLGKFSRCTLFISQNSIAIVAFPVP